MRYYWKLRKANATKVRGFFDSSHDKVADTVAKFAVELGIDLCNPTVRHLKHAPVKIFNFGVYQIVVSAAPIAKAKDE